MSAPELIQTLTRRLSSIAVAVAPIFLRAALAVPFFRSGLTRWDGFLQISDSTTYLFEEEFKLHLFGAEYGFPMPDAVAYLVATAELTLPVLLVLGLATRFAALAMLVMTGVIQLVVPDGWANFHLPWAAMAISIIALGAGPISLDRLIALRFASEAYRQ
ncbi:DoxX family protein [Mesorhizobium sp. VK23D]|nr:DoxX family protein [Mesorhizobium sp. VK23D]MDX8517451.1 DoxX family protein [Mesorhizobium sp. VK23D]